MRLKKFDYRKKENKKKPIIISIAIIMALLIGVTIYTSIAQYIVTKSYNLLQGKVKKVDQGDVQIAVTLVDKEGNETNTDQFPKAGYTFDSERSNCENGSTIEFDEETWTASVTTDQKDKCVFYFYTMHGELALDILEQAKDNNYLYGTTPDFSKVTIDGDYGIYSANDDYGTSYYFRGDVENNYVEFGSYTEDVTIDIPNWIDSGVNVVDIKAGSPMYWRIVRINGDGSIRLIYDGTEKVANGVEHIAAIQATAYNTNYDDAKYVGYTYDVDGIETDSTIKGVVDAWYEKHLKTTYGEFIADSIFCNDRNVQRTDEAGMLYYGSYDRLFTNKKPVLTCTNKEDRYTTDDTTNGNGYLSNPIGLISADEAFMAGVSTSSNKTHYVYSGEYYWTSTPGRFNNNSARIFYLGVGSQSVLYSTASYFGVRPVINIKDNVKFEGKGTIDRPYKVVTELNWLLSVFLCNKNDKYYLIY